MAQLRRGAAMPRIQDRIFRTLRRCLGLFTVLAMAGFLLQGCGAPAEPSDAPPVASAADAYKLGAGDHEIGRASCRERVCQYVYISVDAVSLKQNNQTRTGHHPQHDTRRQLNINNYQTR